MKRTLFLSLLLIILIIAAFTQKEDLLNELFARLEQFNNKFPQEKVHLQLDKPYYSIGEDIWLKAYVVNADHNVLSDQSKILYIDLVDDRDSVRQSLLLPLDHGLTSANLHLNDAILAPGNYHLYAYTKWMTNFGTDVFFRKDITIVNALHGAVNGTMTPKILTGNNGRSLISEITFTSDNGMAYANKPVYYKITAGNRSLAEVKALTDGAGKLTIAKDLKAEDNNVNLNINTTVTPQAGHDIVQNFVIKPLAAVVNVQFFPESGNMVTGIRTKVGFKAIQPNGLGENITGYIIDDGGERAAEFRSGHAGMGVFALQPVVGKNYTAVVTHQDGSVKRYPLPKTDATGYVLNVNMVGDSVSARISASTELINGQQVILVAQNNGLVRYAARIKMDKLSALSYIPLKKFRTGVTQFTLFSPDMSPIAERLIFVNHNDQLTADIKTDKPAYAKRGKVDMELTITDPYDQPVAGTFSLSVVDEGKVKINEDDETSILSDLLLTSDIRGYIESPGYYFNTANADRKKHLDELLLTQGWRRFKWADLQRGIFPTITYPHEQSLAISGTVSTLGGKPVPNGKVSLISFGGGIPMITDTVADEKGHYIFNNLDIADSTKLIVRASDAKQRNNVKITIDKRPILNYTGLNIATLISQHSLALYLKNTQQQFEELGKYGLMKNATALKEVNIKSKKDYFADKVIPNSSNIDPGHADYVLKADKFDRLNNVIDAFYGIAGVEVKGDNRGFRLFSTRGQLSLIHRNGSGSMLIVLDGSPIPDGMSPQVLAGIPPDQIAGIELLLGASKTIYGNDGVNGVAIITTKKGNGGNTSSSSENVGRLNMPGYTAIKQFYAPAYDTPTERSKMADLRSTIYWNPNITTDENGKARLAFYNADGTGTYRVTLEGIDAKGKLAHKVITYSVN